jgi:hypothetical protein
VEHSAGIMAAFDEEHERHGYATEASRGDGARRRSRSFGVENGSTPVRGMSRPFGSDSCLVAVGQGRAGQSREAGPVQEKDRLADHVVGVEMGFSMFDPVGHSDDEVDGVAALVDFEICSPAKSWEAEESEGDLLQSENATDNDTQSPDMEEEDPEWLRSTSDVWLDRWNEQDEERSGDLSVIRQRVGQRRKKRLCWAGGEEGEGDRQRRRARGTVTVGLVESADEMLALQRSVGERGLLDQATYEVTLPVGPRGAGINFCMGKGNVLTVHAFSVFPVGCPNYAKQSGLIAVGDVLVAVNSTYINNLSRDESFEILRSFATCSKLVSS